MRWGCDCLFRRSFLCGLWFVVCGLWLLGHRLLSGRVMQRGESEADTLVSISDLPSWAQDAFAVNKVERLNRVQSQLVDAALYSNENMLLCAPTGAGKTNVALLTMLQVCVRRL